MIVILKHEARQEQIDRLKQFLLGMGLRIDESKGENSTILGLLFLILNTNIALFI